MVGGNFSWADASGVSLCFIGSLWPVQGDSVVHCGGGVGVCMLLPKCSLSFLCDVVRTAVRDRSLKRGRLFSPKRFSTCCCQF